MVKLDVVANFLVQKQALASWTNLQVFGEIKIIVNLVRKISLQF